MKYSHSEPAGDPGENFARVALAGRQWMLAPGHYDGVPLRPGHHAHDAWEFFIPQGGPLRVEVAGHPLIQVPAEVLLLIPPGCVHMGIGRIRQVKGLMLTVLFLPGNDAPDGSLSHGPPSGGGYRFPLTQAGHAQWCSLLGMPPSEMMERASPALALPGWRRERGLAQLQLVLATFAEAAAGVTGGRFEAAGEPRVRRAESILRQRFYEPDLSLAGVAAEIGISPTHLATRFKALTGRTFWKTLIEIRLGRARDLLAGGRYSVKEVAALTGWSNQLYFSSAFSRYYGVPPSRLKGYPGPPLA